jgi:hypothetical protein
MNENEQDEVIVDDVEETNEEVAETTEEVQPKAEKPKRTPQEEYDYHTGKAKRLAKKLGLSEEKTEVKSSSKPSDLDYGQMALLRQEGIKGPGETALFKEIMAETGKGVLDVLDSNYFKSRLNDFRETQATANAIPKGKNRSSQTGVTDEDVAFAKFQETGKLPDDFKTRVAIKNKLVESEKNRNVFSGPSVIGPQVQEY